MKKYFNLKIQNLLLLKFFQFIESSQTEFAQFSCVLLLLGQLLGLLLQHRVDVGGDTSSLQTSQTSLSQGLQ